MANLSVSYADMESAAKELTSRREQIVQDLQAARGFVSNLVTSGFVTDQASVKFDEASDKFTTGAKNTVEGLTDLATYLTQVASALADVDKQLAGKIG